MRVLLIQAAELDAEGRPFRTTKAWFDDLTLAHLAALCPPWVEPVLVIERLDGIDFDAEVDLVGVTAMGVSPMARAYQIADRFRERGVPVVFGGTNFSLHREEVFEHADALVVGEAEPVWHQVLEDCRRGELRRIYDGGIVQDLSGLPVPRYDLFRSRPELRGALYTVQASRGCPHRCDFCAIGTLRAGAIRFRPIDEVVRDVEATGSKRIFFADDNMMANPKYYKELYRRLTPLGVRWIGAATLSIGRDPEMLELARRSGCTLLIIGVESITQGTLDAVSKSHNRVEDYGPLLQRIHDAGIVASCTTIFGFDGDDPGVFDRTVDFYQEHRVRVAPFFLLTPVPGTPTWQELSDAGRILTRDYSRYDTVSAVFEPAQMSARELEEGLFHAYRRLYRPMASLRRLLPPLGNPMADLLAGVMNYQYFQMARKSEFGAFNFN